MNMHIFYEYIWKRVYSTDQISTHDIQQSFARVIHSFLQLSPLL